MRKSFKKLAVAATAGVLALSSALTASAASVANGQWSTGDKGWWFKLNKEGSSFLANTWYWIKDTDGVVRCYYFDQNGWLVSGQTIEGEQVDADGHWVVNGAVQTRDEAQDYATAINFDTIAPAAAVATGAKTTLAAGGAGNPDAAGAVSAASISATRGNAKGGGYKNPIKSSGQGDNPANATFSQGYEDSAVSGAVVTNNWANYTMNTGRTATLEKSGSGTDWYVTDGTAELICTYMPIDKYTAGNTSLDSFVSSYLADTRGYKGGSRDGSVNLGAYSFIQLTKVVRTPYGNMNDHAYIRQIEGTGYVQILTVERNGDSQDFLASLQTIARLR